MDFGDLLRQERLLRGLTQEELAETAGLTSRSIRSLEAGTVKPRRATVNALGTALGLRPGKLQTLMWVCGFGPRPGTTGTDDRGRATTVPAQLPRDIPDFVGRTELSAVLPYELLSPAGAARPDGAPAIVAINGLGGIGKTALATRLAHRVRTAFPDGQLFVDLGADADPDPVLAGMLRDLGVNPARVPAGVAAKSALLRSRTAGRSVLFLLDNARDSAQVRPLLPASSTCGVLVTSRRVLATLEGARHVTLDPLSLRQSQDLVRSIYPTAGPEDEAALAAIMTRCGGLPLALRIAAARLATPDGPGVAAFAEQLGRTTHWLDGLAAEDLSVRGTLAASVELLATADETGRLARRALLFFGRWPGTDVTASCLAVALRTDLPRTRAALRHLVDTSLLQPPRTGPEPRYSPHGLVRAFAAEQSTTDDQDPVAAAFDWHLHALDRAVAVFADYYTRPELPGPPPGELPEFTDPGTAIGWAQDEYPNVVALIRHGTAKGWDDRVPLLAVLAAPFGEQRMRLSEWIETSRLGLECARRSGRRTLEGRLLSTLAAAYRWNGQYAAALACADTALEVLEDLGEQQRIGVLLVARGRIHHAARDFTAAAAAFHDTVAFLRVHGEPYWLASALNQLGMALTQAGDPGAAIEHQREGLQVARDAGLRHFEGVALLNLSISYTMLGRLADADEAIGNAETAAAGLAQPVLEAEIQRQAAEVRHAQGRTGEALALLRDALATMDALDYPETDEVCARLKELLDGSACD